MTYAASTPITAVLDTNIWLDILVFQDPGIASLAGAIRNGRLHACMDLFGMNEFTRVLEYPLGRISLDAKARADVLNACRAMIIAPPAPSARGIAPPYPLPQCRDPNDQPFLELALACRAKWLVTKDRDLLMLARRVSGRQPFAIVTPQAATRLLALEATEGPG